MQRRAAALYAAFFVVVALGAYAVLATASAPPITLEDPDYEASAGETIDVGGRTYTVGDVADATNEGEDLRSTTLSWTNQSARYTATWANNTTVTYDGTNFTVLIANVSDPTEVTLREVRTLPENVTTTTVNGTRYVVVEDGATRELVPVEDYLRDRYGAPRTETFEPGDRIEYANNTTTLASVTPAEATLEWTAPRTNTVDVSEGANVTLGPGERTFAAHFPDNDTLQLTSDLAAYHRQAAQVEYFGERVNGLWGVSILGGLAAITLMGLAYLPSRY